MDDIDTNLSGAEAAGADAAADQADTGGAGAGAPAAKQPPPEAEPNAQPKQPELSEQIAEAVAAERQKWEAEQTERERLAKLPPEEQARAQATKQDQEIAHLQAQLLRRDLRDHAIAKLQNAGLPDGLADLLVYSDKDACDKSLEVAKATFTAQLQEAVNAKLRGKTPEGLSGGKSQEDTARDMIARNIRGGLM